MDIQKVFNDKNRIKTNLSTGVLVLILLYLLNMVKLPTLNKNYLIIVSKYSGIILLISIIIIGIYKYSRYLSKEEIPATLIDLLEITLIISILSILAAFFGIKALIFLLSTYLIYKHNKNKYRNMKMEENLETHIGFNKYINISKQRANNKKVIELLKIEYKGKSKKELQEESLGIKFNIKELKNEFNRNNTVTLGLVSLVVTMYLFILEPLAKDTSKEGRYTIIIAIIIIVVLVIILLVTTFKLSKRKTSYEILDTMLDDLIKKKSQDDFKD